MLRTYLGYTQCSTTYMSSRVFPKTHVKTWFANSTTNRPVTTVTVVPSLSYSTEKSGYLDTGYFDSYIYETWQLQPIIITLKIGNVLMSKVTQNYSDLCLSNRNQQ